MSVDEKTKLVITTADKMMTLVVDDIGHPHNPDAAGYGNWTLSNSIPSERILGAWQIYHGQWIVLSVYQGHYQIHHTLDRITFSLVHDHDVEITGIFYVGFGKMIFCAVDGWWMTTDSGMTWAQIDLTGPVARSAVIITALHNMIILAYGDDKLIYRCAHTLTEFLEPLVWEVVYDASDQVPMYPTICGGPLAIVAGAGNRLIRTANAGDDWDVVAVVDGVIRNVTVTDQSSAPVFLVEVEKNGAVKCYWSYDACDSLVPDANRVSPIVNSKAVIPTGTNAIAGTFVILGKTPSGQIKLDLVQTGGV